MSVVVGASRPRKDLQCLDCNNKISGLNMKCNDCRNNSLVKLCLHCVGKGQNGGMLCGHCLAEGYT